ncbi:RABEPK isoform 6, partial [Pan troglodytes]
GRGSPDTGSITVSGRESESFRGVGPSRVQRTGKGLPWLRPGHFDRISLFFPDPVSYPLELPRGDEICWAGSSGCCGRSRPREASLTELWTLGTAVSGLGRRYTLTVPGDSPCARVGHSCSYLPSVGNAKRGKVFIVGGANPNRSFSDVHTMDLGKHQWDLDTCKGLLPRYEHASFIPSCTPDRIWVFGGANQSGNRNCLQVLNPETRTWTTPEVTSPPPSPRTFHTSSAAIGNQLYVFGGGERG